MFYRANYLHVSSNYLLVSLFILTFVPLIQVSSRCFAQDGILMDANEDGEIQIAAIGDSITFGIGDGIAPGTFVEAAPFTTAPAGYPQRLSQDIGVGVQNGGVPGEIFTEGGSARVLNFLLGSNADIFLLLEGSNDAVFQVSPSLYGFELQKVLNIARVLSKQVVPMTPPPTCCDRAGQTLFTRAYGDQIRDLAFTNDIDFIDVEASWVTACPDADSCSLINRPEGLHPNTAGYDLIAQVIRDVLIGPEEESPEEESTEEEVEEIGGEQ